MRRLLLLLLTALAALSNAQFRVDQEKIPLVQAKRRALIIGASNYQSLGKLQFASSDAKRFRDALVQGFKFTDDSIRFLSDDPANPKKPTSAAILESLDSLLKDPILDKGDLFILFFSGHGIGTKNGDFLCATDSTASNVQETGLPVRVVIDKLANAGLRNVLFVADACRAGEKYEFGSELNELARKFNLAVLLGCEPGKKSYEAPALRSGVFTYFLLRTLGNPKMRTDAGGLWVSRVAANLSQSVFEYTKADYGDNAQQPRAFADPTSDVLLAKFVDPLSDATLTIDQGVVTTKQKLADELDQVIPILFAKNDYARALDVSKQALSLDPENHFAAYYAAVAASLLGRSGEAEKFCNILKLSKSDYFRNLGYVQSTSRATPLADRVRELKAFWESSPKDELHALLVWGNARIFAPQAITKTLVQMMIPSLEVGGRIRTFFEGEVAACENKLTLALEKYQAASKIPGGEITIEDDALVIMQFPLLQQLRRYDELKALIKEQFTKPVVKPTMWVTAAANLKQIGLRDAAIAIIKKGIKEGELSELDVEICATTAGVAIVDLVDDLDAQVKFKPFSWKIRTIATLARGLKTQDAKATTLAFEEARKYCDDDLQIISLSYAIQAAVIEDAQTTLGAPPENFTDFYEIYRVLFFNQAPRMGIDSTVWFQLGEVGLNTLQGPQTFRLFKKHLKDFNASSMLGSEFYTMLFQLAASVEDDEIVKFAADHPSLMDPDRSDIRLLYAVYLASKGDYKGSKPIFDSIGEVSEINKPIKVALQAVFKARAGDMSDLKTFMGQEFTEIEAVLIARGIAALALSDLGQNDLAMPHLQHFTVYQPMTVSSVPHRCAERYLRLLKDQKKSAEADDTLFELLKVNQVSPGIQMCYFGAKPAVANFVGTLKADTTWFTDEIRDEKNPSHKGEINIAAVGQGHIELTISGDGKAIGFIQILDGERFNIVGSVDSLGNLRGEAKSLKHKFEMEAKMLNNEFKKTETFKKSNIGQVLLFTDENGLVTRWLLPAQVLTPQANNLQHR